MSTTSNSPIFEQVIEELFGEVQPEKVISVRKIAPVVYGGILFDLYEVLVDYYNDPENPAKYIALLTQDASKAFHPVEFAKGEVYEEMANLCFLSTEEAVSRLVAEGVLSTPEKPLREFLILTGTLVSVIARDEDEAMEKISDEDYREIEALSEVQGIYGYYQTEQN